MKRLNKITLIIISILAFSACDDFLDKEPLGNISVDEFYQYANDLQLGLNAAYEVLSRDVYQGTEWLFGDAASDDLIRSDALSPTSPFGKIIHFTFSNDDPIILERWKINYIGINKTNWVISEAPEAYKIFNEFDIDSNQTQQEAKSFRKIIGQAKYLRAMFYFNLVKTFGGVPIMPEKLEMTNDGHNFIQPRSTVEEVYEYIEKDLREAILVLDGNISYEDDQQTKGHVKKTAAFALLIKVLAYQAEAGIPGGHQKWHQALQLAGHMIEGIPAEISVEDILDFEILYENQELNQVLTNLAINNEDLTFSFNGFENDQDSIDKITLSMSYDEFIPEGRNIINKHNLIDYENLWLTEYEYSQESIFEVNLIDNQQYKNHGNFLISNNVKELVQASPELNSDRFKDPRLAISFVTKNEFIYDGESVNPLIQPMQTYVTKWLAIKTERATYGENSKNFRIMRLAEVYLFYAEALNETGNNVKATEQLEVLRERANRLLNVSYLNGTPRELQPIEVGTYNTTRDLIWEERRRELCFEHDRFWDMVRQGRATQLMQDYNSSVLTYGEEYQKQYKPIVNEIFPIPQEEINLSNGVLTQNPGY